MRRCLSAMMLACAMAAAEPPVSDKPPTLEDHQLTDEPLHPSDNQAFIDDAVRAFGSRGKAAVLAAQSGWHHQQKGDIAVATKRFNQALLLDPKCAEAYWGLGVMTGQQGKYEFALQMLTRARQLNPANAQLLTDSGIITTRHALSLPAKSAEQKKALDQAIKWFNEAEKLNPSYPPLYTSRAIAYAHLGKTKEAQSNLLRAEVLERASVDTRLVDHLSRKFVAQTPSAQASARTPTVAAAVAPAVAPVTAPEAVPAAPATSQASSPPVPEAVDTDREQITLPAPISIDGLQHELFYVVPATPGDPPGTLRLSTEISAASPR